MKTLIFNAPSINTSFVLREKSQKLAGKAVKAYIAATPTLEGTGVRLPRGGSWSDQPTEASIVVRSEDGWHETTLASYLKTAATPDTPAVTPDTPAVTPDTRDTWLATPDTPAATPDTPAATPDTPAATPDTPAATPAATPAPLDAAAQLLALIQSLQSSAVDEDRVREIVEDALAELPATGGVSTLDVTVNGEPVATVDGPHYMFAEAFKWVSAGVPVMLVGPTGSGKSYLARQLAEALGKPFYTTGACLASYDILGYRNAAGEAMKTPFWLAVENKGLHLCDEMDSYAPPALLAANAAMNGDPVTFAGDEQATPVDGCTFLAATNTWGSGPDREYVGRSQLDAATLNRFVQLPVGYDPAVEHAIAGIAYHGPGVVEEFEGTDPGSVPERITLWLELYHRTQAAVERTKARHIVGPRTLKYGVKGLQAGLSLPVVVARLLRRNLSADKWSAVSPW